MYKKETIIGLVLTFFLSTSSFGAGFSSSSGPFGGGVSAKSLAKNYTYLKAKAGYIRTQNYAKTQTYNLTGQLFQGKAEAGNKIDIKIHDKNAVVKIDQNSAAKTKLYLKNKNILVKAQAKNTLKVEVKGQFTFENEEYAASMGRFTPLGTQFQSTARSRNKLESKGLVRLQTGNIVQSSGQVK